MEAHELLSPRLVEGDDPASSNPRTNFIAVRWSVYRQTFEIPPPSLLFRNEPFYYRVHCSLLLESPLPAILRTSTRVISFFLLFFQASIYIYIEFVDHRPRSTTPSADTKLKTSTKVFTFYLCVFRCVIILASDPNTLLPSLHPSSQHTFAFLCPTDAGSFFQPFGLRGREQRSKGIQRVVRVARKRKRRRRRREKYNLETRSGSRSTLGEFWSKGFGVDTRALDETERREGNDSRHSRERRGIIARGAGSRNGTGKSYGDFSSGFEKYAKLTDRSWSINR